MMKALCLVLGICSAQTDTPRFDLRAHDYGICLPGAKYRICANFDARGSLVDHNRTCEVPPWGMECPQEGTPQS